MTPTLLSWKQPDQASPWGVALLSAILLEICFIALCAFSPRETLLDLIQQGETLAVATPQKAPQVQIVEVDLVPEAPNEEHPEFVVPVEPVAPPQPEALTHNDDPPPPAPPATTAPILTEAPPAEIPAPVAATIPVTPVSDGTVQDLPSAPASASSPQPYAPEEVEVGDKDFPKPPYPYEAKVRHFEGTVTVMISVENGKIIDLQVASSSGYGLLDTSALGWIRRQWKFPDQLTRTLSLPIKYELAQD